MERVRRILVAPTGTVPGPSGSVFNRVNLRVWRRRRRGQEEGREPK